MNGQQLIAGFSRAVWKSLAVKSLRLGWPEGLVRAQLALGKSEVRQLITCGIFEDIFPAMCELEFVLGEVRRLDYEALCSRQTHHGRGYTARFCELEEQAVRVASTHPWDIKESGRSFGV
jgi:hypothetical protein